MRAWIQFVCAAAIALILANPLCICTAESMPATAQETSCCEKNSEDSSLPIAPCECETAHHQGVLAQLDNPGKAQNFATPPQPILSQSTPRVAEAKPGFIAATRHGPPVRHLFSIYRL